MPFTINVLENKKCQSELGQLDSNEKLEKLEKDYAEVKKTLTKYWMKLAFLHTSVQCKQLGFVLRASTQNELISI